jgi:hypothetical protein
MVPIILRENMDNLYFSRNDPSGLVEKESGTLQIAIDSLANNKFLLTWRDENAIITWDGEGWLIKPHQIIIRYWKP